MKQTIPRVDFYVWYHRYAKQNLLFWFLTFECLVAEKENLLWRELLLLVIVVIYMRWLNALILPSTELDIYLVPENERDEVAGVDPGANISSLARGVLYF